MSMRVQPGDPPITTNTEPGTATNLSADTVDGRDSTAFVSATNGKAPDSELLDGKDSTEFLGATAKAADSDKLDGKDSTSLQRPAQGRPTPPKTTRSRYPSTGMLTSSPRTCQRAATRSMQMSSCVTLTMTTMRS
jgi:hypothetical protein